MEIIHGDLFIDNIFFKNNKFQELLIFILLQMTILCMKLLFVLMHLCFDKKIKI